MYHGEFIKAKDYFGKYIRNQETGDLINNCCHQFIAKTQTRIENQEYSGLSYPLNVFDGLELLCVRCGNVYWIMSDDFIEGKNWEKRIKETLDEFDKPQPLEKKPPKNQRSSSNIKE